MTFILDRVLGTCDLLRFFEIFPLVYLHFMFDLQQHRFQSVFVSGQGILNIVWVEYVRLAGYRFIIELLQFISGLLASSPFLPLRFFHFLFFVLNGFVLLEGLVQKILLYILNGFLFDFFSGRRIHESRQ